MGDGRIYKTASTMINMFHKATELEFKEGTILELKFIDGYVKRYDVSVMFDKYPQMRALENRDLFLSGKLMGMYGIIWTDELDLEVESIYMDGETVAVLETPANLTVANAVCTARNDANMSQKELAALTNIDQSDISKIERGVANPSVATLNRIAVALGKKLIISIE